MMPEALIHESLSLLEISTLASSIAAVQVLLLRRAMRHRFGALAAYALWLLVPLAVVAALLPARTLPEVVTLASTGSAAASPIVGVIAALPTPPADLSAWLLGAWLAGGGMALFTFALQQRRFVRRLGRLTPIDADTHVAETATACPALVGAWRPRIVLPSDFAQRYSATERDLIIAHERRHRARGDAQINAFTAALRCVFWFNPLLHFAASRLRFDQELACDASVIARFPRARKTYADAMLKTQLAGQSWREPRLPVGCHWLSGHSLKERITMLKQPLPGRARSAVGLGLAALLVLGGSFAAWASQPPSVSAHATSADAAAHDVAVTTASSPDHGVRYGKRYALAYPASAPVPGSCVAIVTLKIDASGAIADLAALTMHGDAPKATCGKWTRDAAASIMRKPWTFEPAMANGKPVPGLATIPIVFTAHATDTFDTSLIPKGALGVIRVSR